MEVINREINKTVMLKDGHKFRFYKMLNTDVQRCTCYKNKIQVLFYNKYIWWKWILHLKKV